MKLKTKCPGCGQEVNMFTVISAPTPFHMKCGYCRETLRLQSWTWPSTIILSVLSIVYAVFAAIFFNIFDMRLESSLKYTLSIIVLWIIIEIIAGLLVINKGKLHVHNRSKDI